MTWKPLSQTALEGLIEVAEYAMEPEALALWELIRVPPEKWQLSPWGDLGGGFWVVAVLGKKCLWYNDIEDGFNLSPFEEWGCIAKYWCNQTTLSELMHSYFDQILPVREDVRR